ncbi:hypothetical protein VTL71DRAFT_5211 [Oculimacula yallundae]|uniref:Uncharacterized protein n=1 Tax=Oculimacula yallundae TaxID=86028 RepID=A0ABR4C1Y5_9HELO
MIGRTLAVPYFNEHKISSDYTSAVQQEKIMAAHAKIERLRQAITSMEQLSPESSIEDHSRMSTRSSSSTRRGLSDDSVSGKRNAEEQRNSPEPSKRARRSSSRLTQDDSEEFVLVSPGIRRKKASIDVTIEEGRQLTIDDPKSPLERIHPDYDLTEEAVQRVVDVWNALKSPSKTEKPVDLPTSGSIRETDLGSPMSSERSPSVDAESVRRVSVPSARESMGSVAPGSDRSSIHGGENSRVLPARTPVSESHTDRNSFSRRSSPQAKADVSNHVSGQVPSTVQQRKPLPSYRDQSPSRTVAIVSNTGRYHESAERFSGDEQARSPVVSTASQSEPSTHLPSTSDDRRVSSSEHYGLRWEHDSQNSAPLSPQLGRLPDPSHSPPTNRKYSVTSPLSVPSREPGPFSTFPSSFSVLTTESVQQKNQTKYGKKRGRRPNSHNFEQPQTGPSAIVPQSEADKTEPFTQDGSPKQTSESASSTQETARTGQSGLPAISVSHGFYQTKLPPRPTTTPPPVQSSYPSEGYRPPALVFRVDSKAITDLQTADFQSFVEKFKTNARAIIECVKPPSNIHEIDPIMFHGLPFFYQWYTEMTGITDIGSLRFELIDVHWQKEKSFVVPDCNVESFRTLKQYVWDLYWMAMDMNKALGMFRVTISQFPPRGEGSFDVAGTAWKAVNSKIPSKSISAPKSQGIMVVPTGVPKHFQSQPKNSPPNHPLSTLPQLPSIRSTLQSPNLSHINDLKTASPGITLPSLPSPHQSPYQHGPYSRDPGQPSRHNENENRTTGQTQQNLQSQALYGPNDQKRTLREKTLMLEYARDIKIRDADLMPDEYTVKDKLPYKTGAEVCAAIVDRMSAKGLVTVSGKGYITLNVYTGPDETGERYKHITIQPKQTCMLHGGAVVLYFKRQVGHLYRPASQSKVTTTDFADRLGNEGPPISSYDSMAHELAKGRHRDERSLPPPPLAVTSQYQQPPHILHREDSQPGSASTSTIDIKIRVQIDRTGRFSTPFDKSVLRPKITTAEFFKWFASQSRHSPPNPPHNLKFTFKDAMPTPQATEIAAGNEDHFNYMRRDIKAQIEKAKRFLPELREFVILVTVPGWTSPGAEEDEEW